MTTPARCFNVSNERPRVHPLINHLPKIVAVAIAVAIGAYLVVTNVPEGSGPDSTLSEYDARYLAKSAYSTMESNTVGSAVCDAKEYRKDDDTWEIECRFDREDYREVTVWEVTSDGNATLIGTRYE